MLNICLGGVFPLKPVSRRWVVNNSTGTEVSRKRFTLVPDLASTAFMIQSSTWDAMLAECGDIFALPSISEIVTAYVILSRVGKAETMLLLRAFSSSLFRVGKPSGPACLLKLFRPRFASSAPEAQRPYTRNEAKEEYEQLAKQWEVAKKAQKAEGIQW